MMNKNLSSAVLAALMLAFVLGCNCNLGDLANQAIQNVPQTNSNQGTLTNTNANKSTLETATETVLNREKTGIPECDNAVAMVEQQMQADPEQTITERIAREAVRRYVYYQVRENLAKATPQQKAEWAQQCKVLTDNLQTVSP